MNTGPRRRRAAPANEDLTPAHRIYFSLLGLLFAGVGGVALLAPAFVDLPPLHARCLAAMALAQALSWLLALRERDSAAVRILLAQAVATALALLLAPLAQGRPPGLPLALTVLATAGGGAALLWHDRALQAPAERADPALTLVCSALLIGALLLALAPAWTARHWPWTLPSRAALLYTAAFAGWGTAAGMAARERRRSARRLALTGLVLLGGGVALVSLRHLDTFHGFAMGASWVTAFGALAGVAAWRLRPHHFALHASVQR